ncbi:MAG: aldo/keto reductase [Proteobacteria bacterium]|uniref:Aldo/keto reductase n=1 Tax=Candidatus Avisuccinivibrio stercorigallinarum TaxID=2840704 RepID=A0A9D9GRJ7_9GAMM|nr:aldo/keto reductase [Candidatus Avisuccinivibrio stercorigallinarum]
MDFAAQARSFTSTDDCYTLRGDFKIPCVGFGTWKVFDHEQGSEVIAEAIKAGWRHFDTAALYKSEKSVGQAVKSSGLPRSAFFITSKVWKDSLSREGAQRSLKQTLSDLQTDYLDLLLIHWPRRDDKDELWQERLAETWQYFIEAKKAGLVRAIGTANFLPHHFAALHTEMPVINQIEFHVGYTQKEAVDYCRAHDILVEAWAPLGRSALLSHPVVQKVAAQAGVSPAQLCLRYCLQQGLLPLVKSADPQRMRSNRRLFDFTLTDAQLAELNALPDKTAWSGEHPDLAIPAVSVS